MSAAFTQYIDVAQVVLYAFWAFLAGIIYYVRQEDKREGYPLESDRSPFVTVQGFPAIPPPKTFVLQDGSKVYAPRKEQPEAEPKATPIGPWPGAPLEPDGDGMVDAVGPASYAMRKDIPDLMWDGTIKLQPLRVATAYYLDETDADPRGMTVMAADGKPAGTVKDVWIDRAEYIIRYFEVEVSPKAGGPRTVLLPAPLARISGSKNQIGVKSITSKQFASVPLHRQPDVVTRREEDQIGAYYSSGHLYALPERAEPVI